MWLKKKKSFRTSKQKQKKLSLINTMQRMIKTQHSTCRTWTPNEHIIIKVMQFSWKSRVYALITWMLPSVKQSIKGCCIFKSQAVPVVSLAALFPEWPNILYWTIASGLENEGSYRCRLCTEAPDSEVAAATVPLTTTNTYIICRNTVHTCKWFLKGCVMRSGTGWRDKKERICVIKGKHETNLRGGSWESGTC